MNPICPACCRRGGGYLGRRDAVRHRSAELARGRSGRRSGSLGRKRAGVSRPFRHDLLIEIEDGMFVSAREREWSAASGEPLNPDGYKERARR